MVLPTLVLFLLISLSTAEVSSKIGVNYGQLGDNLPSPARTIELMKSMKVGRIKLYDANPGILGLLSGTKIEVSIMIPNHLISLVASNKTFADEWIAKNVISHYPETMIRFLLVGNEVLSYSSGQDKQMWRDLVPAIRLIKSSLKGHNITNIKVGTPLAMDVMESSFPPSSGSFRPNVRDLVIAPLLQFLNRTNSFFFLDVYPYLSWAVNSDRISLDYALLRSTESYSDPGTGLTYTNLLDQMLDSVIFAMEKLGYQNIRLAIAETGWPNSGDDAERGANIQNAATYNKNLVKKMTAKPTSGTPARPGVVIPIFIFAMYNENQKAGPGTERHWGLLHPDGTPIYDIDLTGKRPFSVSSNTKFSALPPGSRHSYRSHNDFRLH